MWALCILTVPLLAGLAIEQYAIVTRLPGVKRLSSNACLLWKTHVPRLFQSEWKSSAFPSGPNYEVQVFSQDPLILYIRDFLSEEEIQHLLEVR